jgi:uncharacterized protein
MIIVPREAQAKIEARIAAGKVIVVLGPRRVGKTFLLQQILKQQDEPYLYWSGEDVEVANSLANRSIGHYRQIIGSYRFLIIDEAQKIPEIGAVLKLMIDHIEGLKIIATGSSAFDLNKRLGEPLTGRKWTHYLFPFSESELRFLEDPITQISGLKQRMVLGNYPELIHLQNQVDKRGYMSGIVNDYLLKDILALDGLRNTHKLIDLLRLIAFQVGSEVSLSELGQQLAMDKGSVERYLNMLAEIFVLFNIRGFSRNLRKEITKSSKWYFHDNGIRNALIANFNPLESRNDQGLLWENYMISERIKRQHYDGIISNNYFWRTYDQQEIDWIEEREGKLFAYEMKWNKPHAKVPKAWAEAYPESSFEVVHQGSWMDFAIGQG